MKLFENGESFMLPAHQSYRVNLYFQQRGISAEIKPQFLCNPNAASQCLLNERMIEKFINLLKRHDVKSIRSFARGHSGLVFESDEWPSELIKVNWEDRLHVSSYPVFVPDLTWGEVDYLVVTLQPKIETYSDPEERKAASELISCALSSWYGFTGKWIDEDDVGFVEFEGEKIPLCYDYHADINRGATVRAAQQFERAPSMPPDQHFAEWMCPDGNSIVSKVFEKYFGPPKRCGINRIGREMYNPLHLQPSAISPIYF